jgi:hypothetical protein
MPEVVADVPLDSKLPKNVAVPNHPVSSGHPEDEEENPEVADSSNLVECELNSPSLKIKISLAAEHSNGQSARVCMSENACLKLINDYAAGHNNSMEKGPETSPGSPAKCTKIFPGSKGTCHNARVLSDEQIAGVLAEMGK